MLSVNMAVTGAADGARATAIDHAYTASVKWDNGSSAQSTGHSALYYDHVFSFCRWALGIKIAGSCRR